MRYLLLFPLCLLCAAAAQAGCAIEVTFINQSNKTAVISKSESKVRLAGGPVSGNPTGVPGTWKTFMGSNVTVRPNKEKSRAYTLDLPCAAGARKFKFHITQGQSTSWENKTVVVQIDKKVKVKIKS